jgi:hypothetical protein
MRARHEVTSLKFKTSEEAGRCNAGLAGSRGARPQARPPSRALLASCREAAKVPSRQWLAWPNSAKPSEPLGGAGGISSPRRALGGKWLELLKEVAPRIARVNPPASRLSAETTTTTCSPTICCCSHHEGHCQRTPPVDVG